MLDHLLESSRRDDSDMRSSIGLGEGETQGKSIEVNFMHLFWSSGMFSLYPQCMCLHCIQLSVRQPCNGRLRNARTGIV